MIALGVEVILTEEALGAAPALTVQTLTPIVLLTEAALEAAPGHTVVGLGAAVLLHEAAVGTAVLLFGAEAAAVVAGVRVVAAAEALRAASLVAVWVATAALPEA